MDTVVYTVTVNTLVHTPLLTYASVLIGLIGIFWNQEEYMLPNVLHILFLLGAGCSS